MGIAGFNVLYQIEDEVQRMTEPKPHYDEEDVPAALERVTQDGSGFESVDELPESDFVSFSANDVELVEGSDDK
jgi:hypothetical protein